MAAHFDVGKMVVRFVFDCPVQLVQLWVVPRGGRGLQSGLDLWHAVVQASAEPNGALGSHRLTAPADAIGRALPQGHTVANQQCLQYNEIEVKVFKFVKSVFTTMGKHWRTFCRQKYPPKLTRVSNSSLNERGTPQCVVQHQTIAPEHLEHLCKKTAPAPWQKAREPADVVLASTTWASSVIRHANPVA